MRNMFLQNSCRNELGRLVPDLFFFFKKALYNWKIGDQHLSFNIVWLTSTWAYSESKLFSISHY